MEMKQTEFVSRMVYLKRSYTGTFWEDGHWSDIIKMYWGRFNKYDEDVIKASFAEAVDRYPRRFPSLGEMTVIFGEQYDKIQREKTHKAQNKFLPPPTGSKDVAKAQFCELCSEAMRMHNGDLDDVRNKQILTAILVALGSYVFGKEDPRNVTGFDFHDDPQKRYSISNHLLSIWEKKGYTVSEVAKGLRQIPDKCTGWPTVGLMDDLIRGWNVEGWPGGQVISERKGRSESGSEIP